MDLSLHGDVLFRSTPSQYNEICSRLIQRSRPSALPRFADSIAEEVHVNRYLCSRETEILASLLGYSQLFTILYLTSLP